MNKRQIKIIELLLQNEAHKVNFPISNYNTFTKFM